VTVGNSDLLHFAVERVYLSDLRAFEQELLLIQVGKVLLSGAKGVAEVGELTLKFVLGEG
jgi:hypothetical protein